MTSAMRDFVTFFQGFSWSRVKASMKANKISEPKPLEHYIAITEYTKQEKGEVTLKVDMLVEVIEKTESGWWFVNAEDEQGWVPSTCLVREDGVKESSTKTFSPGEEEQYLCTEEFRPESHDELAMERGAVVDVIEKNLEGWWRVRYNGREGYVPATYLVKSEALRMNRRPLVKTQVSQSAQSSGPIIVKSLHEVSDLLKEEEEEEEVEEEWDDEPIYTIHEVSKILREDKRGEQETDQIYEAIAKQRSLKRGGSVRPPPRPALGPKKTRESPVNRASPLVRSNSLSKVYTTIAPFSDPVGDGISFQEGETVMVLQKAEGGWWYIQLDGKEGWAPASYIKENTENASNTSPRINTPVSTVIEEEGEKAERSSKTLQGRMTVPPPEPPRKSPSPEPTSKLTPPAPPAKVRAASPQRAQNSTSLAAGKGPLPTLPKKITPTDSTEKPTPPSKQGVSSGGAGRNSDSPRASESRPAPSLPLKPTSKGPQGPPLPPVKKSTPADTTKNGSTDGTEGKPTAGIANALKAKFESNSRPSSGTDKPTSVGQPAVSENKSNSTPSNVSAGKRLFEKAKPPGVNPAGKPAWMQKQQDRNSSHLMTPSAATDVTEKRKSVGDLASVLKSKFENIQKNNEERSEPSGGANFGQKKSTVPSQPLVAPKVDNLSPRSAAGKPNRPVTPPTRKKEQEAELIPHKYSSRPLPPQPGRSSRPLPSVPSQGSGDTSGSRESVNEPARSAGVAGLANALKAKLEGNMQQASKPEGQSSRTSPGSGPTVKSALKPGGTALKPKQPEQKFEAQNNNNTPVTSLKASDSKQQYRAVVDFDGVNEGEMPLVCGQTVTVLERSEGWWYVQDGGKEGWVPAAYVEEISPSSQSKPASSQPKTTDHAVFRVCSDFIGQQEGELTLSEGQEVTVMEQPEGGWWFVKYGRSEGWAPSSYLEQVL